MEIKKTSNKKTEDLNKEILNCSRCRLSGTRIHAICGEGNRDAKLMLIAQAPGETEDREGRMFIGPSGRVLDELLANAGIDRGEVYMTNLIKCALPKYRKPKQDEIEICGKYLDKEIELINPGVIATLGHYAARYIFGKFDLSVPHKPESGSVYGKLFLTGDRKILPLQHPASVLYNPILKEELMKSYRKLKVLAEDCKWHPLCPMKGCYEEGKLDKKWIEMYCRGDWESCIRYQMEENGKPHPDWMLPDGSVDERLHREVMR